MFEQYQVDGLFEICIGQNNCRIFAAHFQLILLSLPRCPACDLLSSGHGTGKGDSGGLRMRHESLTDLRARDKRRRRGPLVAVPFTAVDRKR